MMDQIIINDSSSIMTDFNMESHDTGKRICMEFDDAVIDTWRKTKETSPKKTRYIMFLLIYANE